MIKKICKYQQQEEENIRYDVIFVRIWFVGTSPTLAEYLKIKGIQVLANQTKMA